MTADPKPLSKRAQQRLREAAAGRAAAVERLAAVLVGTGDERRWLAAAAANPADIVEDAIWAAVSSNYRCIARAEDEISLVHQHTETLVRERRTMIAAAKRDVP